MKILLLGRGGQVGWELQRSLSVLGELVALDFDPAFNPDGLCGDFANLAGLADTVRAVRPDVIVNAAAHTAVDKAESEPDLARTINALAPAVLATEAARLGAWLVHYSTDYVFDGSGDQPWRESDAPAPLSVYGQTKLEGERAVAANPKHLTLRTSWVYAARGGNFAKTMLRLASERDTLTVINDQIGAPTWARLLAEVSAQLLYRVLRGDIDLKTQGGLYHVSGGGQTSWWGFAKAIQQASGLNCRLLPIPSRDYSSPAKRPAYSVLDNGRLREVFGLVPPAWEASLAQCLAEA